MRSETDTAKKVADAMHSGGVRSGIGWALLYGLAFVLSMYLIMGGENSHSGIMALLGLIIFISFAPLTFIYLYDMDPWWQELDQDPPQLGPVRAIAFWLRVLIGAVWVMRVRNRNAQTSALAEARKRILHDHEEWRKKVAVLYEGLPKGE